MPTTEPRLGPARKLDGRPHGLQRVRVALSVRNAGIVYALILLAAVLAIVSEAKGRPAYLSSTNVANILDQSSLFGIMAVLMTVVLVSGNFDLSVGSIAGLAAIVTLKEIDAHGILPAVLLALGCGLFIGLFNGLITQYVGINAFIVTLGTLTAVRGLSMTVTGGTTVAPSHPSSLHDLSTMGQGTLGSADVLLWLGALLVAVGVLALVLRLRRGGSLRAPLGLCVAGLLGLGIGGPALIDLPLTKRVYLMLAVTAITWLTLTYTTIGRRLYAVGSNDEAAYLAGIRVNRYRVVPFILSGLAAALAGVLFAADLSSADSTALSGAELTVIAAAILGGTSLYGGSGSVVKSVVGAIFLMTITNGFNVLNLGATYQDLVQGIIIIVAAAIYTVALRRRQAPPSVVAASGSEPPEAGSPADDVNAVAPRS